MFFTKLGMNVMAHAATPITFTSVFLQNKKKNEYLADKQICDLECKINVLT